MEALMRLFIIAASAGMLALTPFASAQEEAAAEKTGLKIGQQAPAFKLQDQTGVQRSLRDLSRNADYVALVFYRSSNW